MMWTSRRRREVKNGLTTKDTTIRRKLGNQRSQSLDLESTTPRRWREYFRSQKGRTKDQQNQCIKSMTPRKNSSNWQVSSLTSLPEDNNNVHSMDVHFKASKSSDVNDCIATSMKNDMNQETQMEGMCEVELQEEEEEDFEKCTSTAKQRHSRSQSIWNFTKNRSSSLRSCMGNMKRSRNRRFRYQKGNLSMDDEVLLQSSDGEI